MSREPGLMLGSMDRPFTRSRPLVRTHRTGAAWTGTSAAADAAIAAARVAQDAVGHGLPSSLLRAEDYSDYVGEQIGHYLAPDRDKVFANVSLNDFLAVSPTFTDESQNYRINEQATAAYGRVDFALDEAISGNLGLRYTRTRLRTQGAGGFALAAAGIPLIAEDTGLDYGRSVYFDVHDGSVTIKSLRAGHVVL